MNCGVVDPKSKVNSFVVLESLSNTRAAFTEFVSHELLLGSSLLRFTTRNSGKFILLLVL